MSTDAQRPVIIIDLNEGREWAECPMCEQERRLNYSVGWYEGPVRQAPGETLTLPNGETVEACGMCVCRDCHYGFYQIDEEPRVMTADPTALLALAAECEAAAGPDRALDARIAELALRACVYTAFSPWQMSYGGATRKVPKYTAKVDAALALLREVLTGWCYDMDDLGDTPCAHLYGPGSGEGQSQHGKAPTLPRAIVAASLRAVAARGEG